ncbi:hypothetical protein D9756_005038 [Leucocoprinus leucothites]|uniref:BTB domain-containing protein n=1 Tax=Leucocoprinus leucothites TaxID=201217 RepID=A0A8H5G9L1_9AGAR|nr:hypothetical protein D9756_005038 [Leucoagaricus leucothites]
MYRINLGFRTCEAINTWKPYPLSTVSCPVDSCSELATIHMMEKALSNTVKDDTYYFVDGNHEFRVGNCLFRLHRSILRMHSIFFQNMFDLPQGSDETSRNLEDDEPMVCDDSPDAFRALCWALYADPLDTGNEREISATNVKKISHIGLLAHKYEFPKIERWIINICGELPSPEVLVAFPLDDLKYFAQVISDCGWTEVKKQFNARIIKAVWQEKDAAAIASASTLRSAIYVADHISDELLRAHVYYYYLASTSWDLYPGERRQKKTALKLDIISKRSAVLPLSSLSETQKLCLFRGFSSLQTVRNLLRHCPVTEPLQCSCEKVQRGIDSCHRGWTSWWLSQLGEFEGSASMDDPIKLLDMMIKKAQKNPPLFSRHHHQATVSNTDGAAVPKDCCAFVVEQLKELKKALEDDLPNYFR